MDGRPKRSRPSYTKMFPPLDLASSQKSNHDPVNDPQIQYTDASDTGSSGESLQYTATSAKVKPRPKVRGRRAIASIVPRELIECKWDACPAKLIDVATFARHAELLHLRKLGRGKARCEWSGCTAAANTFSQRAAWSADGQLDRSTIDAMRQHLVAHVGEEQREREEFVADFQKDVNGKVVIPTIVPERSGNNALLPYALIERPTLEQEALNHLQTQPFMGRYSGNWYPEDQGIPPTQSQLDAAARYRREQLEDPHREQDGQARRPMRSMAQLMREFKSAGGIVQDMSVLRRVANDDLGPAVGELSLVDESESDQTSLPAEGTGSDNPRISDDEGSTASDEQSDVNSQRADEDMQRDEGEADETSPRPPVARKGVAGKRVSPSSSSSEPSIVTRPTGVKPHIAVQVWGPSKSTQRDPLVAGDGFAELDPEGNKVSIPRSANPWPATDTNGPRSAAQRLRGSSIGQAPHEVIEIGSSP